VGNSLGEAQENNRNAYLKIAAISFDMSIVFQGSPRGPIFVTVQLLEVLRLYHSNLTSLVSVDCKWRNYLDIQKWNTTVYRA
jgi:hypothetical protein